MWAVLSYPGKKGDRWDPDQFFETGILLVKQILQSLEGMALKLPTGAALDFGCGIGRITQALAPYFDRVVGVDIAPSMVREAHRLNRHPDRVSYVLNAMPNLGSFEDECFDFVVSYITLQHIPRETALQYLDEMLRVLKPGGLAVIQAPSGTARTPAGLATRLLPAAIRSSLRGMDMHRIPSEKIDDVIRGRGCRLISVADDGAAGPRWISLRYTIVK